MSVFFKIMPNLLRNIASAAPISIGGPFSANSEANLIVHPGASGVAGVVLRAEAHAAWLAIA